MNSAKSVLMSASEAAAHIQPGAIASVAFQATTGAVVKAAKSSQEFITETMPQAATNGAEWVAANPGTAVALGVGAAGLIVVAAPAVVASPALAAAGFGAEGVMAGSLAAGAQATMGGYVTAGGTFATLQSAAAGGYGVPIVYGAVQGVGSAVVGGAAGAVAWMKSKM